MNRQWTEAPLVRVATVRVSSVDKKTTDGEQPVWLCNYVDVYKNDEVSSSLDFMAATATPDEIKAFALRAGDSVITKDSETPFDIASPAFVAENLPEVLCGYHLALVRPSNRVVPRFLYWVLASRRIRSDLGSKAMGVTRFGLRQGDIKSVRIPMPPLGQQARIADHLDRETARLERAIRLAGRLERVLEERLWGHASRVTRAAESMNGPASPNNADGWRLMALKHCFDRMDYGIGDRSVPEGRFRVLGMGHVGRGTVEVSGESFVDLVERDLLLEPGDLLFNRTNSASLVGKVGEFLGEGGTSTFASYLVRMRPGREFSSRFLNYLLNTDETLALARSMAFPSIGQSNLNPRRYGQMGVLIPPLGQQKAIAEELDESSSRIRAAQEALRRQVALLAERREAVVSATLAGGGLAGGSASA